MIDQLSSIDIEFDDVTFRRIIVTSQKSCELKPAPSTAPHFAKEPIFSANNPRRPWGLGAIARDTNLLWRLAGSHVRQPGRHRRNDTVPPGTLPPFLKETSERIHSSVRVRLHCEGLGLNDKEVWTCAGLHPHWKLKRRQLSFGDANTHETDSASSVAPDARSLQDPTGNGPFVWVYVGPESEAPPERTLVEESLGPYEQRLLALTAGEPSIWAVAENHKEHP